MQEAVIIGSGLAGMATACYLAQQGVNVTVIEKHDKPGGRARRLDDAGYSFDMGPSWYWMPDVFDRFFRDFGKNTINYYHLKRLNPSYEVFWENQRWKIPADYTALQALFENAEKGAAIKLDEFMKDAAEKYSIGMQKLAYKPGNTAMEFASWDVVSAALRLDLFIPMSRHINRYFKNPQLQQLLSFPILFLGALPDKIPALYSLMNYADFKLGTWYPEGGIYSVVNAIFNLSLELGVKFRFNEEVKSIVTEGQHAKGVTTRTGFTAAHLLIGAADYNYIENQLLNPKERTYSAKYWNSRIMAPSCIIYYVGLNKKIPELQHHSLFFDVSFENHAREIYTTPQWPKQPMFYVCCPSRTDNTVAPEGHENLFMLIPVAAGLEGDNEAIRKQYFDKMIERMEAKLGTSLKANVVYYKSYGVTDFKQDYNAFKGNAYGLANTLQQTAFLKPAMRSKKIKNLIYAGQLTVPGPGMPPALISGKLAAKEGVHYLSQLKTICR